MTYTLKDLDDVFWQRVRVMAVTKEMTIKQLILDLLKGTLDEFEND